jgi:CDGSH-type Zn-finger protein
MPAGATRRGAWTHNQAADLLATFGHIPLEPYPGMGELWLCRCGTCGARVQMRLGNVRKGSGQRGCRQCAPNARVAPEYAAAVMRAAGYTTEEAYPGAAKPWACICRCGASVAIRYNDVRRGQRGCTRCAGPGRGDPDAAAAE